MIGDEGNEFLNIDEAAEEIGWNRVTVFEWMKTLGIEKHKFLRNRRTYISIKDVNRLKQIKEKPWLAEAIKEEIAKEKDTSGNTKEVA